MAKAMRDDSRSGIAFMAGPVRRVFAAAARSGGSSWAGVLRTYAHNARAPAGDLLLRLILPLDDRAHKLKLVDQVAQLVLDSIWRLALQQLDDALLALDHLLELPAHCLRIG